MSISGKKILVTGGSGFIGSHLCRRLLSEGAIVHVLVKYNSIIDNIRLSGIWNEITPVEADLRNPDSLTVINRIRPNIIFHLAAYNHVGDSFTQVSEAIDSNTKGTVNLLEAYQEYDRLVYISTSEVYGYQTDIPFAEESIPQPLSPYAVGKYAGELYSVLKWRSSHMPIVVLRPFNAFGPYQSPRAITSELIIKCLTGEDVITTEGVQTREFNYVSNLIDGFLLASVSETAIGEVINLGCGEEISIRDLVIKIHNLTKSTSKLRIGELPTRPGEIYRMFASNKKALDILKWQPNISHEEGLKNTIAWFRKYLAQFEDKRSALSELSLQEQF